MTDWTQYCCQTCTVRSYKNKKALEAKQGNPLDFMFSIMYVCQECGNKRCPRAQDHRYRCSKSNKTNQLPVLEGCDCTIPQEDDCWLCGPVHDCPHCDGTEPIKDGDMCPLHDVVSDNA